MSDPDNDAEPAEGDVFEVRPVSFGELARWRDRALAAEAERDRLKALCDEFVWGEENPREMRTVHEQRDRMRAVVEAARAYRRAKQDPANGAPMHSTRAKLARLRTQVATDGLFDTLDALDEGSA